jgi:hypothetical protein
MVAAGVISVGFAHSTDVGDLIGATFKDALERLRELLPNERADATTTLARFVGIRPGDLIALKAHGAPRGHEARLVIARYAVVKGKNLPRYRLLPELGQSLDVDYFDEQVPIELPLGYGRTLHHIDKQARIEMIFGAYAEAAEGSVLESRRSFDKATHTTKVLSRGEYLMTRVHNELQGALHARLQSIYGSDAVRFEENNIDLSVELDDRFILIEVKASLSPISCIREALGQMLFYAWRSKSIHPTIEYVVVGPSHPSTSDLSFIQYLSKATGISLHYCTPSTYKAN